MPRYYAICVLVASNQLRSPLVVNVWQICEEGRHWEGGREDKWRWKGSWCCRDPNRAFSPVQKVKWYGKMETLPSYLRHDICAEIRDWRDEVHRFTTIGYSSQLLFPFCKSSTVQPFQTISSILGAELTFALPLHFTLIPSPSPHLITLFRKNKWREYRGGRIIIIPRESKIIFDDLEISIE